MIQRSYAVNNGDHIVRLRRLLRKARRSLTRRSSAAAVDSVSALALPWTDIVRVFIDYKVSMTVRHCTLEYHQFRLYLWPLSLYRVIILLIDYILLTDLGVMLPSYYANSDYILLTDLCVVLLSCYGNSA